jgi:hypothetical protein
LSEAYRIWPSDIVDKLEDNGNVSYHPVIVFSIKNKGGCLFRYTTVITEANPLGWPAVVFNFFWLDYYFYADFFAGYKYMLKEALTCLRWLIDMQYSAVSALPVKLANIKAKEYYPKYYGKSVEEITSMFLELARSVAVGTTATGTEPPPIDIYLWGATLAKPPGRRSNTERGLSEPVRASQLFEKRWVYHRRVMPYTQLIVPLASSTAELQDLLRLGYLTAYPDFSAHTKRDKSEYPPRYNVIKLKAVVSQELLEKLGLSYTDTFGLAVAVLSLLRSPLNDTYKALYSKLAPRRSLEAVNS